MRRQWETLGRKADGECDQLSKSASHWQQFQDAKEELLPWLESSEKYLDEEIDKITNDDELADQQNQHEVHCNKIRC